MGNYQARLLNKQTSCQTNIPKIFTAILVVVLSLILSLTVSSCFAKINVSNLEYQPNSQLGGHPGGIFFDKDSAQKYYIKFYPDEMHARAEILAIKIYAIFGVHVPKVNTEIMKESGSKKEKLAFISKWDDKLERICNKSEDCTKRMKDARKQLAKIHLVSALVKNTDAFPKNISFKEGKIFVVDAGSSFKTGKRNASVYGPEADEFCSIIDKRNSSAELFSSSFKKYTMKNTDYLIYWLNRHWNENEIKAAIKASGIDDGEMIFTNLELRFKHLKILLQELKEDNTLCQ